MSPRDGHTWRSSCPNSGVRRRVLLAERGERDVLPALPLVELGEVLLADRSVGAAEEHAQRRLHRGGGVPPNAPSCQRRTVHRLPGDPASPRVPTPLRSRRPDPRATPRIRPIFPGCYGDPVPSGPVRGGVVIDAVTAWASPGLVTTPAAAVAYVTATFAVTVETSDPRPGAEPVDALTAALLGCGFALLTDTAQHPALQAAPALPDWSAVLDPPPRIRIDAPDGLFYDGDLGTAVPDRWHAITQARGRVTVLVASQLNLHQPDRTQQTEYALRDGRLLAGQVQLPVRSAG